MPDAVNAPLQHPASADVPARQATDSARAHPLVAVLVLVAAVIVASLAWVVASPVGASPDEDFHVGAMWCPPPIEDSGCQIGTKDGRKAVIVPQTLAKENVTCYAYDHDNSARCTFAASDDLTAPTLRWDDGNYPWGYYQFAHLFVQHSTNRAVLTLRVFNTLLAITLLGSIIALADSGLRRAIAVALTTAWLPMGFYFIAGMNPSSWAMTGTFAFAAGLLAATRSVGVPVVIGVQGRFSNVEFYQPRYMLPLFAVFMLMLLAPSPARADATGLRVGSEAFRLPTSIAGRVGAGIVAALWALTNARALYLVIERYAFGRTSHTQPLDLTTRNLSAGNEWWWPGAPLGPMAVWMIGAAAGALAIVLAVSLLSRSSMHEDESH